MPSGNTCFVGPFGHQLAICLTLHSVVIWVFFEYALSDVQTFSIWIWFPVMFIEAFALLIIVKRIEEKFTGQHEKMKLDF
jgi:hypothetical protein